MILKKVDVFVVVALSCVMYTVGIPAYAKAPTLSHVEVMLAELDYEMEDCLVGEEWVCEYFDQRDSWTDEFESSFDTAANSYGIRKGHIPLWDSHVTHPLIPKAEGKQVVVFQDVREVQDYDFSFDPILEVVGKNTSLDAFEGDCADYPDANCISLVDFEPGTHLPENTAAYCTYYPHDRQVAFDDNSVGDYYYFHEFGHALGLSHKFNDLGVMSYTAADSFFSWDELSALQDAYPREIVKVPLD